MKKKFLIITLAWACSLFQFAEAQPLLNKKVLSNGVQIPEAWPPRYPVGIERKEMPVPYLEMPQKMIPVNTGRQLFVDDFLIESTDLTRVYHSPVYSNKNPVLEPDKEWESNLAGPYAAPFSDGIWFDEKDNKFKMWYLAGKPGNKQSFYTCYAESDDGIRWTKPDLGLYGHTNIVDTFNRDASTIWLDKNEQQLSKRFKMFNVEHDHINRRWHIVLKYSADGIRWGKGVAQSGRVGDRTTVFHNPLSGKWALSMRSDAPIGRARSYAEHENPEMLVSITHEKRDDVDDKNMVYWFGADDKEPRHPSYPEVLPQIYNHDAIAYESLMLGYFTVWEGPENDVCAKEGIQKRNETLIGFSRDGFHWSRPSHKPFMGVNETGSAWNWGNVQSIAGTPVVKGDSLYFYVSGRRLSKSYWDAHTSTGLATLRRDGFASMKTDNQGTLRTQTINFIGEYFFVNADIKGELRVELLDTNGTPISGFTKADCIPMTTNSTKHQIIWKDKKTLRQLKNKNIKARFYLSNGELYSFWISPWKTGESNGFTAGGGPGLNESGIDKP